MTAAVEISGLNKRYGRRTAVHELDLRVATGSVFGLIGPNGAGKTTTIRTLIDTIRPTSGEVRVLGTEPRAGGAALRRRIGYVPGELQLEGRASGHRLLAFYAEVSGDSGKTASTLRHAGELADRLGVDLNRPVRTLSKGNKQKVGLIQAFMHRPELLILDEPTSGLDPLMQREFLQLVREARDVGQTVLLSSHVLSEIQQTADDVAVLSSGRIVAEGDVASLRLGSVRRVRVRIAGTDAAATRAAFEKIPGVQRLDADPSIPSSPSSRRRASPGASGTRGPRSGDGAGDSRDGPGDSGNEGVQLTATIEGTIDPLVKLLARYEVQELTVEEPDLEESVLRLYGGEHA
ncbi:ABC transporter ATP-binding protein [Microbacterium sp.]|uniref:ABC transporter ATP-binding protein n=1 Tax=Microbacterium sp. TaxID=51671 RepID=UPI0026388C86|nr:ABC transporter ATP-binding protein [Microbacterium sp.]